MQYKTHSYHLPQGLGRILLYVTIGNFELLICHVNASDRPFWPDQLRAEVAILAATASEVENAKTLDSHRKRSATTVKFVCNFLWYFLERLPDDIRRRTRRGASTIRVFKCA